MMDAQGGGPHTLEAASLRVCAVRIEAVAGFEPT